MNFVAIDFETANESMDSAISVGVVKFENGIKTDSFYSLIKPEPNLTPEYFLPRFIDIHGLNYENIKDAKSFYEVWKSGLENFLDGKIILLAAKEKGCSSVDELMKACGQWMKIIR